MYNNIKFYENWVPHPNSNINVQLLYKYVNTWGKIF